MRYDVQAAFKLLADEAERVLARGSLEQSVMIGQLNWMRNMLLNTESSLEAEAELMHTMSVAKLMGKPWHRTKRKPKARRTVLTLMDDGAGYQPTANGPMTMPGNSNVRAVGK